MGGLLSAAVPIVLEKNPFTFPFRMSKLSLLP